MGRSKIRGVFKLLTIVVVILLLVSTVRVLQGNTPLTLTYFMECLSELDLDFSNLYVQFENVQVSLDKFIYFDFESTVNNSTGNNFFEKGIFVALEYVKTFLMVNVEIIKSGLSIVVDIWDFLLSFFRFIMKLFGTATI